MDAVCWPDPKSLALVSVEAEGPANYENCLLGNLQKTFAEVDARSQSGQRYSRIKTKQWFNVETGGNHYRRPKCVGVPTNKETGATIYYYK